jgi:flagellar operon protein
MVDNSMYIPQKPLVPVSDAQKVKALQEQNRSAHKGAPVSFEDTLSGVIGKSKEIRFSGHAQERLRMRNIELNPQQMQRISDAVDRAAGKGARDSLLLVDNLAAVVSVANRTVITVVDDASMRENVFTNIDSAVIA